MVEVVKKDKETSEGLVRRFFRRMQESKTLIQARKSQFKVKKNQKTAEARCYLQKKS